MEAKLLLKGLCARYEDILEENFVGMYVHGSYAMDGFNPAKSDLDFIVVCHEVPCDSEKCAMVDATLAYMHTAPAKGLEMHLMLREDCLNFQYPPKFQLHYSPAHTDIYLQDPYGYVGWMRGEDPDLGAHLMVMKQRGLCVKGAPLHEVFGQVPPVAYFQGILSDLGWSEEDAMYHVLNHCRSLAYVREGRVLSKREGGLWAIEHMDKVCHPVICRALDCYAGDETMAPSPEARTFCESTLEIIKREAAGKGLLE